MTYHKLFDGILSVLVLTLSLSTFTASAFADDKSGSRTPKVLEVGPGKEFLFPSVAAEFSGDGDTVLIDAAGFYDDDVAIWKANDLIIRGVNGVPHIKAKRIIPNGKAIWVLQGDNYYIENIEFSGAKVRDKNGAALRLEGASIKIVNCFFHHNQNGILSGKNTKSDISIENSVFSYNGHGRGQTHNVYIGEVRSLNFIGNLSHHAIIGHTLKSRASNNYVAYNRLLDGTDGNSSYLIDLPNGGNSIVIGNVIQQSDKTDNWAMVAFGMEGLKHKENSLYLVHNTFINYRNSAMFVTIKPGAKVRVTNNLFVGKGRLPEENGVHASNNLMQDLPGKFVAPESFDFRPKMDTDIIDQAVPFVLPGGTELIPEWQIGDKELRRREMRGKALDIGAFEFGL